MNEKRGKEMMVTAACCLGLTLAWGIDSGVLSLSFKVGLDSQEHKRILSSAFL